MTGETVDPAVAVEIVWLIDALRFEEGDSITIVCDNPDFNGLPNCCVICNAWWTFHINREVRGDTVLACLRAAMELMMAARKAEKHFLAIAIELTGKPE